MASMKIGTRVRVKGGMSEFDGTTGTIQGTEKDGRTTLYRVVLDAPVEVEGVGMVTDDLWAGCHLVNLDAAERAKRNRRALDAEMRGIGMKKVRGSLGGIYWE